MKGKTKTSSGKHPDLIPAQATRHERQRAMKEQIKKFKSPKLSEMYSISIPGLRITYYISTRKRYRERLLEFIAKYPEYDLKCRQPTKK